MPYKRKTWFLTCIVTFFLLSLVACGRVPTASTPSPIATAPTTAIPAPATPTIPPTQTATLPVATVSVVEPSPTPTSPATAAKDRLTARTQQMGLDNTGLWQYEPGNFVHPRTLEVIGDTAYLLDSGRVLRLDLLHPTPPQVILQAGAIIDAVPVLEPFDLDSAGEMLYVLDRAGDVYNYNTVTNLWQLDRYDRRVRDVSSQYYVALSADTDTRFLLETSYKFVQAYTDDGDIYAWLSGDGREVDLSVQGGFAYVLTQAGAEMGQVVKVEAALRTQVEWTLSGVLTRPRSILATPTTLYILDQAGSHLQAFTAASGKFIRDWTFTEPISTFWADDTRLILAGRDALYFVERPEQLATITGGVLLASGQPHDPLTLATLEGLLRPIVDTSVALREFQLPGAPRHYRLGVHEGMDFYKTIGTPVQAVAAGVIIRADTSYITPTAWLFGQMHETVLAEGFTSPEVLDFYRGRQIWLQLDNGWVAHYAHLSAIAPGIEVGTRVTVGQRLGNVGNSGSPITQENPDGDVHLHFELWLGDHYLGQFLHPIEVREWLEIIWP
ncbi:MAG: M23 family metallopeptidase [Chloroflexi bacterium]|nr:M23 family metallopeptidase [Chloroflexota bacterium]MBP8055230.1 M23 family metallopeptidase [Chloroflexota bacterium]